MSAASPRENKPHFQSAENKRSSVSSGSSRVPSIAATFPAGTNILENSATFSIFLQKEIISHERH